MGDFSLMFGAKGGDGPLPSGDPKEKSNKLWPWGTAPAQLLNACGSICPKPIFFLEGARTGEQDGAVLL